MMHAKIIVCHINKDPTNNHAPAPLFSPHPSYCQRLIALLDNADRVHLENLGIHALRALKIEYTWKIWERDVILGIVRLSVPSSAVHLKISFNQQLTNLRKWTSLAPNSCRQETGFLGRANALQYTIVICQVPNYSNGRLSRFEACLLF